MPQPTPSSILDEAVSVGDLTRAIRALLEEGIGDVIVMGEISNYKHHSSGHRYFTLKDADAQIGAVMWRMRPLAFVPEDGMKVIAFGRLAVYAPQGKYQIDVTALRPYGLGDLYAALERLKRELSARGWFDAGFKKPLPVLPRRIGIVTSPTGAAIRDILSTLARRYPVATAIVRPTLVQGDGAAEDIAKAIAEFNREGVDVMIVGRGGGSIEDLWAFNTEIVAEAIFQSDVPVISAVGHETDVTIADFVADVRAATPTAAAELATPITAEDMLAGVDRMRERMTERITYHIDTLMQMAMAFVDGSAARRLQERIHMNEQRIDVVSERMRRTMHNRIHMNIQRISTMPETMRRAVSARIESSLRRVDHAQQLLNTLHPYAPLRRGYAVVERNGHLLGAGEPLRPNDEVVIRRQTEQSTVRVLDTTPL